MNTDDLRIALAAARVASRRQLLGLAALSLGLPRLAAAHGDAHAKPASRGVAPEQTDWGIAGDPRRVTRTVDIQMLDSLRFEPNRLRVKLGQTVRLRVRNAGVVMHELVLGTSAALQEHAELMKRFPDMEHSEAHMAHVPTKQRGEIVWNFNRIGRIEFACLMPGHYDGGMRGTIEVTP